MARISRQVKVTLGARNLPVGLLRFESDGRRQMSAFEYDPVFLEAPWGFDLSPALPRREGLFHASGTREDPRAALTGAIADATPDSWGRSLMRTALGPGLTEFDYLVLSDDRTRQGALRYLDPEGVQIQDPDRPVSRRSVGLEQLRSLALRFDRDPVRAVEEARELVGAGGSQGGARPKANVISPDGLFIAKFTTERDGRPIERMEVATLKLARDAGLRAADAELALGGSAFPIALIRRFDRRQDTRIPYISARTALDAPEGTYDRIAETIRRIAQDPREELRELYGRIAFTILVANCDDHLKNHGFLYAGNGRWKLSPAFDINPQPERHRVLETPISELTGNEASIGDLIEAAPFFDLDEDEGLAIADRVGTAIRENWRARLEEQGVTGAEARACEPAFLNPEMNILQKMTALRRPAGGRGFHDMMAVRRPDAPLPDPQPE